jgi:cell wall-associated NlpC family hydrolase
LTVPVVLLAVTAALTGAAPAHAGPSVGDIERQIDHAWSVLEPTIERHNATRQDLAARRRQADELAARIAPLQQRIDAAMTQVGVLAVRAYKGEEAANVNALLASGSPRRVIDQLQLLDQFARHQRREVRAVVELRQAYAARKATLDALVARLARAEADLAARKAEIDAQIAGLQKLRLRAYGGGAGGALKPAPCPVAYPGGAVAAVVRFACAQIGRPYVWGAAGPGGYDCSGLTMAAWARAGVDLPHNAARQRAATRPVSRSELRPGDLVFHPDLTHVGLYVGDGWMVHAPTTGDRVRMRRLTGGSFTYARPS